MNIREIAKLAEVSVSTVSKIINHKDDSISSETRERVLKIAKEYNYVPYASTISPSTKTWLLGILVKSSVSIDTTVNGMIETAQKNGYFTIVCESHGDLTQELKNITALCKNRVDGVIWEPVASESINHAVHFQELSIPFLTFNGNEAETTIIDYEGLGYRATETLIKKRHTNIACLLADGKRTKLFLSGYKKCLFNHQITLNEELIFHDINEVLIYKIGNHMISGIVSSHFSKALSMYEAIDTLHYRIPYDISLISLKGDARDQVDFPHISTYTIPNMEFGIYLCKKLLSVVEKSNSTFEIFQPEIVLDHSYSIDIPFNLKSKRIAVVGSINIDNYLNVDNLPHSGKTVSTSTSSIYPGGKGMNQAIGAAKLGHRVSLIGNVGSDIESGKIYETLKEYDIDSLGIKRCNGTNTGKAYIFVEPNGDSMISILSGANGYFSPSDIKEKEHLFENTGYCLVQTEVPLEAVLEACLTSHRHGAKNILKPSACGKLSDALLKEIDIIVPNSDELSELCPAADSMEEQAQYLIDKGVETVIVTLGHKGCYVKTIGWDDYFPASAFPSIDNTGASDAFISALASYLLYGYTLREAIRIATYAAGFSISREGVIPALINRSSLETYIRQIDAGLIHPIG